MTVPVLQQVWAVEIRMYEFVKDEVMHSNLLFDIVRRFETQGAGPIEFVQVDIDLFKDTPDVL